MLRLGVRVAVAGIVGVEPPVPILTAVLDTAGCTQTRVIYGAIPIASVVADSRVVHGTTVAATIERVARLGIAATVIHGPRRGGRAL